MRPLTAAVPLAAVLRVAAAVAAAQGPPPTVFFEGHNAQGMYRFVTVR